MKEKKTMKKIRKSVGSEVRELLSAESITAPIPHQSALQARIDGWIFRSSVAGVAAAVIIPSVVFVHRLLELSL